MSSSSPAFGAAHHCFWGQRSSRVWEHCLALMAQLPPALHVSATQCQALAEVQGVTPQGASPPLLFRAVCESCVRWHPEVPLGHRGAQGSQASVLVVA